MPAGAPNLDETFAFLDVLASRDSQVLQAVLGQSIPCLKEAALSDEVVNEAALSGLAAHGERVDGICELPPDYAGRPVDPGPVDLPGHRRDWVLYGQKSPEQACADMQAQVQQQLDEFWASV